MTRRSKRTLERAVEDLSADTSAHDSPAIVHEDPETGEWIDLNGRPVDTDTRPITAIVPLDEQIEELLADGGPSNEQLDGQLKGDQ